MATSANPFAVLHQTDGAASSTARGRGGQFRGAINFQPRGAAAFQPRGAASFTPRGGGNTNPQNSTFRGRGRGRGTAPAARAGRGNTRGAGATSNTWRANKPEAQATSTPSTFSPFGQLKQSQPTATAAASASIPQKKPSFTGFGRGSTRGGFGGPSTRGGSSHNAKRAPQLQPAAPPANGMIGGAVPVEDISTLGGYNERYEKLKIDRAKQREQAIKDGQMADPNQPMSLNKAITPVGTCTSMCPEFERVERIVQKMVDKSEKYLHPTTNSLQNMEAKMLKRFRRSAAGYDEQLPSDIRTPGTLLQTMNYLTRHVIGGPEPLGIIHKFVWDRTRSIRNDFSVQQLTQEEDVKIAVTCLERIARFHIVSLHLLSSPANEEPFDRHQEREQLNNTMLSLMYYYDDNRDRIPFPNEDEFRAYYILFSIHDQRPDLEARVQKWPSELRNAPRVRVALEMFAAAGNTWEYQGTLDAKRPNAIAQGFYARFFNLVDSPGVSYLMACVAEIYFNHMRQTAIRSIWKGYCRYPASQQHKNEEWTVDELTDVLCFDDNEQTIEFCAAQDLEFAENANGDTYLNWGSRPVDSIAFQPSSDHSFSETYVESKRAGRNLVALVLGLNVKEAATLGMVDRSLLSERTNDHMAMDNDDSLFVSEDENEAPATVSQPFGTVNGTNNQQSTIANPFGSIFQPPANTASVQSSTSGTSIAKPQESQPPAPSNPFGSLFPTTSTAGSTSTPSSPSLNPFAKPFATPAANPEPIKSTPSITAANVQKSPSPFSSTNPFGQSAQDKGPASPTTTLFTPPASFPGASNGSPNSQIPLTAPPSGSPFANPAASSVKPNQPNGLTAGQSPSIFDIAKPAPTEAPASLFSLSAPTPTIQTPQIAPAESPQPTAPVAAPNTFAMSAPAPEKKVPSISSTVQPPSQPAPTFQPSASGPLPGAGKLAAPPPPSFTNGAARDAVSAPQSTPLFSSKSIEAQPVAPPTPILHHAELPKPAQPALNVQQVHEIDTSVKAVSEEQVAAEAAQEAERQQAWIASLREAADRRRHTVSTPGSRKRVLEQETPPKSGVKATKVSKAERPKKSLALSSIKPLPKLPILEQIESLTARKPAEKKAEPPKPNNVDEDELLLSAARIAAESMRTGPRILDGYPASSPFEPWRSSFSPGSSAASYTFSRSQSPQQPSMNGYHVALAPDTDLGLGRTLSRTEQRIRMTGGKGLAYKPLNLTPKKSWRTPSKK